MARQIARQRSTAAQTTGQREKTDGLTVIAVVGARSSPAWNSCAFTDPAMSQQAQQRQNNMQGHSHCKKQSRRAIDRDGEHHARLPDTHVDTARDAHLPLRRQQRHEHRQVVAVSVHRDPVPAVVRRAGRVQHLRVVQVQTM
jgi:hypothetical protein